MSKIRFSGQHKAPQFRLWPSIVSLSSCSSVNLILTRFEGYLSVCVYKVSKTRDKEKMEPTQQGEERVQKGTGLHNKAN